MHVHPCRAHTCTPPASPLNGWYVHVHARPAHLLPLTSQLAVLHIWQVFRGFLLDEIVRAADALSREALMQLVTSTALQRLPAPPFSRQLLTALAPPLTPEDEKVVHGIRRLTSFFLGGRPPHALAHAHETHGPALLPFLPSCPSALLPSCLSGPVPSCPSGPSALLPFWPCAPSCVPSSHAARVPSPERRRSRLGRDWRRECRRRRDHERPAAAPIAYPRPGCAPPRARAAAGVAGTSAPSRRPSALLIAVGPSAPAN